MVATAETGYSAPQESQVSVSVSPQAQRNGSSETLTHEEIWAIYQDARHYAEELNEKRKDLELSLSVMNKRPDIDWNPAEYERQQRQLMEVSAKLETAVKRCNELEGEPSVHARLRRTLGALIGETGAEGTGKQPQSTTDWPVLAED